MYRVQVSISNMRCCAAMNADNIKFGRWCMSPCVSPRNSFVAHQKRQPQINACPSRLWSAQAGSSSGLAQPVPLKCRIAPRVSPGRRSSRESTSMITDQRAIRFMAPWCDACSPSSFLVLTHPCNPCTLQLIVLTVLRLMHMDAQNACQYL